MAKLLTGIYCIRHIASGERYVGQAMDINRRWKDHRKALDRGLASSPALQAAWTKYGAEAFAFEVLEECAPELLEEREDEHMRTGCALNLVQPLPRLEIRLDDPQFADLFVQLDDAVAAMTDEERAAYLAELDAEEKADEAEEAAREAAGNVLDEFCAALFQKPKGQSPSAEELQRAEAYLAQGEVTPISLVARALVAPGDLKRAERLLLRACDVDERVSVKRGWGVRPTTYEGLAKFYRKQKRYADEVAILQRFARQPQARGAKPSELIQRLEKARALRDKAGSRRGGGDNSSRG